MISVRFLPMEEKYVIACLTTYSWILYSGSSLGGPYSQVGILTPLSEEGFKITVCVQEGIDFLSGT